jgi:hypothetical protein
MPKMVMDDHKMKRVGSALKFLMCYTHEGDKFLDSIVTGDEIWGFHHTPESKQHHYNGAIRMTWFKGPAADFYDSGIKKIVPRLNKCLDNAGDYVEK